MDDRKIVVLDLNDILPNRFQPRIKFAEDSIAELAESIREHGVIQPIVVRPLGDRYEIIAGERRYKASVLAGKETIPAIITELNDKDSAEVALIENVQRQDLTPIEEAISYKKILDMGYLTQEELATKLGKTQSTVANKLRLLNLDDRVQEALLESKISERHARSLLKISNKDNQVRMLERIINERLTVRRTDEEISKMMNSNENNNIEILDFGDGQKNVSPVQTPTMNVGIPTTPIIEDVAVPPVTPVMSPFPGVAPVINPVNTEPVSEAVPTINVAPTENIAPAMNSADILNTPISNPFGVSMETENDDNSSDEDILKPGKFFNFSDLENGAPQPTVASAVNGSVSTTPEISAIPVINNEVVNTPVTSSIPEVPVGPTMTIPSMETVIPTNSVAETNMNNNFIPNIGIEAIPGVGEKPTPIIPTNPEPLIQTPIAEAMSNQTIAVPNITPVPSYSELDAELYNNPVTPTTGNTADKMKQAIDLIRECASKIEALGLEIETEEYDFEDMYQVIFKVNK